MIIHSGLLPDFRNASMTFRRFAYFFLSATDVELLAFACSSSHSPVMSIFLSKSRIASAPMPALNAPEPC